MQDDFIRPDIVIYFLDMVGVVACATAGTLLAQSKGMDISGCILVAMVNASHTHVRSSKLLISNSSQAHSPDSKKQPSIRAVFYWVN